MSEPTYQTFYQQALKQCLSMQSSLMQSHVLTNGETVWVRQAGTRNSIWRYRLLKLIQQISGIHILQPVPNIGGISSLETEVSRITTLSAAGICVPQILAQQKNATMISNIGEKNLEKEWRNCQNQPKSLLQRWQLGLDAISKVHQKQQYLSESFARNMIFINDQQIGFIDFENDPLSVMPLSQCQARDWLCYLHSGAQLMLEFGVGSEAKKLWNNILHNQPESVHTIIHTSLRQIRWMKHLTAKFYGKDAHKLAAMSTFA